MFGTISKTAEKAEAKLTSLLKVQSSREQCEQEMLSQVEERRHIRNTTKQKYQDFRDATKTKTESSKDKLRLLRYVFQVTVT